MAAEFASLDSWMDHYDASIPTGFADNVMLQIHRLEELQSSKIFSSRWAEVGVVFAGAVVAVWNLIQFVLGVIVPVLT